MRLPARTAGAGEGNYTVRRMIARAYRPREGPQTITSGLIEHGYGNRRGDTKHIDSGRSRVILIIRIGYINTRTVGVAVAIQAESRTSYRDWLPAARVIAGRYEKEFQTRRSVREVDVKLRLIAVLGPDTRGYEGDVPELRRAGGGAGGQGDDGFDDRRDPDAGQRAAPEELPAIETGTGLKKVQPHDLVDRGRRFLLVDPRGRGYLGERGPAGARAPHEGDPGGQAVHRAGAPVQDENLLAVDADDEVFRPPRWHRAVRFVLHGLLPGTRRKQPGKRVQPAADRFASQCDTIITLRHTLIPGGLETGGATQPGQPPPLEVTPCRDAGLPALLPRASPLERERGK